MSRTYKDRPNFLRGDIRLRFSPVRGLNWPVLNNLPIAEEMSARDAEERTPWKESHSTWRKFAKRQRAKQQRRAEVPDYRRTRDLY